MASFYEALIEELISVFYFADGVNIVCTNHAIKGQNYFYLYLWYEVRGLSILCKICINFICYSRLSSISLNV